MSDSAPLFMRARYDEFVDAQAARLGVEPPDTLKGIRDFGLTADHISKLVDKSGLTKYANGAGLNIIGMRAIRRPAPARREFTAPKPKTEKRARPGQAVRKRAKARAACPTTRSPKASEKSSAWPGDQGATSMAQALIPRGTVRN